MTEKIGIISLGLIGGSILKSLSAARYEICAVTRNKQAVQAAKAYTPYVSDDCPDQIGLWLGVQIVDHYMKCHPDMAIGELLRMDDYKGMLRESGYHPSDKKR